MPCLQAVYDVHRPQERALRVAGWEGGAVALGLMKCCVERLELLNMETVYDSENG